MLRTALNSLRFVLRHPLTRHARLQALSRVARWQLGSRVLGFPAVVPFAGKTCLVVEPGMTGATGNVYVGLHEFEDMAFVAHVLRPDDLFVDVGANVGSYTLLAAGVAGARALSLEPVPETFSRLRRNILLNDLQDRVRCESIAVAAAEGFLRMTTHLDTMNRITDSAEGSLVRAATLDSLLGAEAPTLLKIDVEGHEASALAGASNTLANPALLGVILEIASDSLDHGAGVRKVLEHHGFSGYRYAPFERAIRPSQEGGAHNVLFLRDAQLAQIQQRCRDAKPVELPWQSI